MFKIESLGLNFNAFCAVFWKIFKVIRFLEISVMPVRRLMYFKLVLLFKTLFWKCIYVIWLIRLIIMARTEAQRKFGLPGGGRNLPFTLESRKGNYQRVKSKFLYFKMYLCAFGGETDFYLIVSRFESIFMLFG